MGQRLRIWGTGVTFGSDASEETARAVGRRYRDAGLQIVQVADEQNISTPVERVRAAATQRLARSLRLASAAGALAVVTGAGHCDPVRPEDVFAAHPDNFGQAALERLAATCREALAAAGGATARLLVETWVILPLCNLLRAAEAVRLVGDPRFGILFDPVNLMNLDNYFDNGSFLRRAVQHLGPAIGLVHARDTLLHSERFTFQFSEEALGRGALDYPALLEALTALPADVPLCVEHARSEEEASAALDHLRRLADRLGVPTG